MNTSDVSTNESNYFNKQISDCKEQIKEITNWKGSVVVNRTGQSMLSKLNPFKGSPSPNPNPSPETKLKDKVESLQNAVTVIAIDSGNLTDPQRVVVAGVIDRAMNVLIELEDRPELKDKDDKDYMKQGVNYLKLLKTKCIQSLIEGAAIYPKIPLKNALAALKANMNPQAEQGKLKIPSPEQILQNYRNPDKSVKVTGLVKDLKAPKILKTFGDSERRQIGKDPQGLEKLEKLWAEGKMISSNEMKRLFEDWRLTTPPPHLLSDFIHSPQFTTTLVENIKQLKAEKQTESIDNVKQDLLLLASTATPEHPSLFLAVLKTGIVSVDECLRMMRDIGKPHFFLEDLIQFISIPPAHYEATEALQIPPAPEGSSLNDLMKLFDKHQEAIRIMADGKRINDEDGIEVSYHELRNDLQKLVDRIQQRIPFYGCPRENSPDFEPFFQHLETLYKHIADQLNQEKDAEVVIPTLIQIALGGDHCGARYMGEGQSIFRLQRGQFSTLPDQIQQDLANLRTAIVEEISNEYCRKGAHREFEPVPESISTHYDSSESDTESDSESSSSSLHFRPLPTVSSSDSSDSDTESDSDSSSSSLHFRPLPTVSSSESSESDTDSDSDWTDVSHTYNEIVRLIGKERGLMGTQFIYDDVYKNLAAIKDVNIARREFDERYTPEKLVTYMADKFNTKPSSYDAEIVTDWFKENAPQEIIDRFTAQIRENLLSISAPEKKEEFGYLTLDAFFKRKQDVEINLALNKQARLINDMIKMRQYARAAQFMGFNLDPAKSVEDQVRGEYARRLAPINERFTRLSEEATHQALQTDEEFKVFLEKNGVEGFLTWEDVVHQQIPELARQQYLSEFVLEKDPLTGETSNQIRKEAILYFLSTNGALDASPVQTLFT